jgi:hypothetical protein
MAHALAERLNYERSCVEHNLPAYLETSASIIEEGVRLNEKIKSNNPSET